LVIIGMELSRVGVSLSRRQQTGERLSSSDDSNQDGGCHQVFPASIPLKGLPTGFRQVAEDRER
jgi:hypothetical protein